MSIEQPPFENSTFEKLAQSEQQKKTFEKENLENILTKLPFVEKIIMPERLPINPNLYLGVGCVGVDGERSIGYGLDFLMFLWMAEKCRQKLETSGNCTIFLMDRKPVGSEILNVQNEEALIKEIVQMIGIKENWKIKKFSQLFSNKDLPINESYEKTQSYLTKEILCNNGFQIGWLHPQYKLSYGKKDELYFARHFKENFPEEKKIGFILGLFPSLAKDFVAGPPYLIRERTRNKRILLIEENLNNKIGKIGKNTRKNLVPVVKMFEEIGLTQDTNQKLEQTFFRGMNNLSKKLQNSYWKTFPS